MDCAFSSPPSGYETDLSANFIPDSAGGALVTSGVDDPSSSDQQADVRILVVGDRKRFV